MLSNAAKVSLINLAEEAKIKKERKKEHAIVIAFVRFSQTLAFPKLEDTNANTSKHTANR